MSRTHFHDSSSHYSNTTFKSNIFEDNVVTKNSSKTTKSNVKLNITKTYPWLIQYLITFLIHRQFYLFIF